MLIVLENKTTPNGVVVYSSIRKWTKKASQMTDPVSFQSKNNINTIKIILIFDQGCGSIYEDPICKAAKKSMAPKIANTRNTVRILRPG